MKNKIDKVIILKFAEHKEKNKLLTLFGLENGLFTALARGIKDPKAKLKFLGLPFALCEVELLDGSSPIIKTASLLTQFGGISSDIDKFESACLCASAVLALTQKGENDPTLFALVLTALSEICENGAEGVRSTTTAIKFVLDALENAGYKLELSACSSCAKEFGKTFVDFGTGEVLCENCAGPHAVQVKTSTIETLKKIENAAAEDFEDDHLKNSKKLLDKLVLTIFGKKLNLFD